MIVDSAVYMNGHRHAGDIPLEETYEASRKQGCFAWIGLHEPTEDEFDAVRREFGLHELAVEDAIKAHQRPKLEVYGETLFIVLKTAEYEADRVRFGEILLFAGEDSSSPCATATSPCTRSASRWSDGRTCSLTAP